MTRLDVRRDSDQLLERDQLVALLGQPFCERSTGSPQRVDQLVPSVGTDRVGVPRMQSVGAAVADTVHRCHGGPDGHRIEGAVRSQQIDPAVDPNACRADVREHASFDGANDRGHRQAGGGDEILECGVVLDLDHVRTFERLLDGEDTVVGRELPDLTDLAAGHRSADHRLVTERVRPPRPRRHRAGPAPPEHRPASRSARPWARLGG